MEVQQHLQNYEDSQFLHSLNDSFFSSKIDETQLFNSLSETIFHSPSPKEVKMQRIQDSPLKQYYSSPFSNRTVNASSTEKSSSNSGINALIKAIIRDNKASLISLANEPSATLDRETASRLLHICCEFNSVECAAALLNGEVCGVIPLINEVDSSTGYTPLHTAAENHAVRCIELLIRKRGRTDFKTRKVLRETSSDSGSGTGCVSQYLLPLELSLRCVRMDIKWGPDDPLDDLLLFLSEKNLSAISLLAEKTKETAEVAYAIAMEGRVSALAALLMVAADKVNGSVLEIRNHSDFSAEKTSVYICVIKEAISIFKLSRDKQKGVGEIDHNVFHSVGEKERRTLLLREIELLHFFGASRTDSGCMGKKSVSPLILACKAEDEEVIKLLLMMDINVSDVDVEGSSALHWCIKASKVSNPTQIRILLLLLKHGARVRQKDMWGLTAVHIAAGNGNLEALKILLSRDPESVHLTSELKETPLFLAAKNDLIESAQLLLRFGANTEIHNLRRERPIELAKSQQMRSALNRTSVVITNRDSQQKYTVQNDEVVSTREVLPKEACSASESVNSSSDGDICKYFASTTGCARGSSCFYKHSEEELCNKKLRSRVARSLALEEFKRRIFVGGLPATIDSDSLACIIEEKFGSVDDAKVLEMETDGQIVSRGFGFVTFKDEMSVSSALEAHYTDIWGKKVEMKTAIPKCLLSFDDSEDESPRVESPKETVQESMQIKSTQLDRQELSKTNTSEVENKHEQMSWANRVANPQLDLSVKERNALKKRSSVKDMPKWFQILKKWLPNFLYKMQRNAEKGEYYSLSSLKTDFKALFGLELDHTSLGYPKLSDFVKSYPGLCSVKFINTGGTTPNHMILLPAKSSRPSSLTVSKTNYPSLHPGTPVREHVDSQKSPMQPLPSDCKDADVAKIEFDKDSLSSSSSGTSPDVTVVNTVVIETVEDVKPSSPDMMPVTNPRFLQFLAPDPIFHARTWRGNGGFMAVPDEHFRPKHLVLEYLAQKKKEVFFLRSIKFYDDYAASVKRGTCFGCGDNKMVWANYPCQHLLWCSDCKFKVVRVAEVGIPSHKCVVCDHVVGKIDLVRWSKLQVQSSYDEMEFPPIHAACLRRDTEPEASSLKRIPG